MLRIWRLCGLVLFILGCGDGSQSLPTGTDDALASEACNELEHDADPLSSAATPEAALSSALIHEAHGFMVELSAPTSYVALEVPEHHVDYAVFSSPSGVITAIETVGVNDLIERNNGACPDAGQSDFRVHFHEIDHSILTLTGSGSVWLYFARTGGGGHGHEE